MSSQKTKGGRGNAPTSGGKKGGKSGGGEAKREEVLQAVLITDSFQDRYKPLTVEKPRCLLPLANVPMIEYTLEFLAMNGVQEVVLYSGPHTDQVEQYVNESRWSQSSRLCPFSSIQFIRLADARSIGDVLRDLDKRNIMEGDFLVVHGDLVSNIALDPILAAHKARRQADPTSIMTMVLRDGGFAPHRSKAPAITPVFTLDTKTQRCLQYEEIHPLQTLHTSLLDSDIPKELSTDFEVRADLIDPEIDICTPEVLALWSESFDYDLPRRNFLHGVLKDWELNGKSIHVHVLEEGYAVRARNLIMYQAVSNDVLGGWAFPFLPKCNLFPGQVYTAAGNGSFVEETMTVNDRSKLSKSIVGGQTVIAASALVSHSIIGRGCRIGNNVRIENSVIWDGAVIHDGSTVTQSLIASRVVVGKDCVISSGSILSFGTVIDDNVKLSPNLLISTIDALGSPVQNAATTVGSSGKGAIFHEDRRSEYDDTDDESDDEESDGAHDPSTLLKNLTLPDEVRQRRGSMASISTFNSDVDGNAMDDDEFDLGGDGGDGSAFSHFNSNSRVNSGLPAAGTFHARTLSDGSADSQLDEEDAEDAESGRSSTQFHLDAVSGLVDSLRSGGNDFDAAKLEFMGLRLSNNASDSAVRRAVATAFTQYTIELIEQGSEVTKAAQKSFASQKGIDKFLDDVAIGDEESEQVEFVLALQRALAHQAAVPHASLDVSRLGTLLAALLQQLYSRDLLEEESILGWWNDARSQRDGAFQALRSRCQALINWLEESEEEDDDDDESDDE